MEENALSHILLKDYEQDYVPSGPRTNFLLQRFLTVYLGTPAAKDLSIRKNDPCEDGKDGGFEHARRAG
jgi:hypothetical protein